MIKYIKCDEEREIFAKREMFCEECEKKFIAEIELLRKRIVELEEQIKKTTYFNIGGKI